MIARVETCLSRMFGYSANIRIMLWIYCEFVQRIIF